MAWWRRQGRGGMMEQYRATRDPFSFSSSETGVADRVGTVASITEIVARLTSATEKLRGAYQC